jgi:hypothetical protein
VVVNQKHRCRIIFQTRLGQFTRIH